MEVTNADACPPSGGEVNVVFVEAMEAGRVHRYSIHVDRNGSVVSGVQLDPIHLIHVEPSGIPMPIKIAAEKAWREKCHG